MRSYAGLCFGSVTLLGYTVIARPGTWFLLDRPAILAVASYVLLGMAYMSVCVRAAGAIRSTTRRYYHDFGTTRVKVWKIGPVVIWRSIVR